MELWLGLHRVRRVPFRLFPALLIAAFGLCADGSGHLLLHDGCSDVCADGGCQLSQLLHLEGVYAAPSTFCRAAQHETSVAEPPYLRVSEGMMLPGETLGAKVAFTLRAPVTPDHGAERFVAAFTGCTFLWCGRRGDNKLLIVNLIERERTILHRQQPTGATKSTRQGDAVACRVSVDGEKVRLVGTVTVKGSATSSS